MDSKDKQVQGIDQDEYLDEHRDDQGRRIISQNGLGVLVVNASGTTWIPDPSAETRVDWDPDLARMADQPGCCPDCGYPFGTNPDGCTGGCWTHSIQKLPEQAIEEPIDPSIWRGIWITEQAYSTDVLSHRQFALAKLVGTDQAKGDFAALQTARSDGSASSWAPMDLSALLTGLVEQEQAVGLVRSDGVGLLYVGRINEIHGEPESGKSWAALIESKRQLEAGGLVRYLDFDSDADEIVGRLLALGVPTDAIRERFHYSRVEDAATDANLADFTGALAPDGTAYTLIVVDGVNDAFSTFGLSPNDNDDAIKFFAVFLRPLRAHGAIVLTLDHVIKASEGRGRFSIGAQAKLAKIDGASFVIEIADPLGKADVKRGLPGLRGVIVLRVGKDRKGSVRSASGEYRKSDRTQESARLVIDATAVDGLIVATVQPPFVKAPPVVTVDAHGNVSIVDADEAVKIAERMPDVVAQILKLRPRGNNPGVSREQVREEVTGAHRTVKLAAADLAVTRGLLAKVPGPRGADYFVRPATAGGVSK